MYTLGYMIKEVKEGYELVINLEPQHCMKTTYALIVSHQNNRLLEYKSIKKDIKFIITLPFDTEGIEIALICKEFIGLDQYLVVKNVKEVVGKEFIYEENLSVEKPLVNDKRIDKKQCKHKCKNKELCKHMCCKSTNDGLRQGTLNEFLQIDNPPHYSENALNEDLTKDLTEDIPQPIEVEQQESQIDTDELEEICEFSEESTEGFFEQLITKDTIH